MLTEQERQEFFTVDVEELQETALEISTHIRKPIYIQFSPLDTANVLKPEMHGQGI